MTLLSRDVKLGSNMTGLQDLSPVPHHYGGLQLVSKLGPELKFAGGNHYVDDYQHLCSEVDHPAINPCVVPHHHGGLHARLDLS